MFNLFYCYSNSIMQTMPMDVLSILSIIVKTMKRPNVLKLFTHLLSILCNELFAIDEINSNETFFMLELPIFGSKTAFTLHNSFSETYLGFLFLEESYILVGEEWGLISLASPGRRSGPASYRRGHPTRSSVQMFSILKLGKRSSEGGTQKGAARRKHLYNTHECVCGRRPAPDFAKTEQRRYRRDRFSRRTRRAP